MASVQSYQELHVWQRAIEWVEAIYRTTDAWPSDERFGLISQARRSAVSVAANIAEGAARRTPGEFKQFIGIARGSLAETETLIIIARRLGFAPDQTARTLLEAAAEINRMLAGLARSLDR